MFTGYFGKKISKVIAAILVASLVMPLSACKRDRRIFPDIGTPTSTNESIDDVVEEPETPNNQDYSFRAITVALPYSQHTIDYLSKLYYAKLTGQLGDRTGETIELEVLDAINTPWYINSVQTSYVGVSVDNLSVWQETNSMPDIYLADNIDSVIDGGYAVSLDSYLADNESFSANNLYMDSLEECTRGGQIYGIPHYATSVMIAANMDYLPEDGVLISGYTWNNLVTYLTSINERFEESELSIVPFADAYELAPYIAGSFDGNNHSFMLYGEDNATSSVNTVINSIRDLYLQDLSSGSDIEGNDPRYTRVAAMWLVNSYEMDFWNNYYSNSIYYLPMPSGDGETPFPYMTIYPICLSGDTDNSDFATDFAAFITLDCDAQMLIRRLEPQNGYIPMTSNPALWMSIMDETMWGRTLFSYEGMMNDVNYCPGNNANSLYSHVNSYLSTYFAGVEDGNEEEFDLNSCYGG